MKVSIRAFPEGFAPPGLHSRNPPLEPKPRSNLNFVFEFPDSIYTERYMSLLGDNGPNYRNASLLANVERLRDKNYMLIHGTFDDNVHYQHSMMLSHELERRVILFRQQVSAL